MIEIKSLSGVVIYRSKTATRTIDALHEALESGADLRDANLYGADLRAANLSSANLYGADLRAANLSSANLYGADLRDANLRDANLSGADLSDANLYGADLRGADLRDANLSGANLSGADLSGADLSNADLRGAYLCGVDLSNADLRDADLCGADLTPIRLDVEAICAAAPDEVPALLAAIRAGRMDGSHYEGECSCLLGTIATTRGVSYKELPGLWPDASRPAEMFALSVERGDTPATSQVSALLADWIAAWLEAERA